MINLEWLRTFRAVYRTKSLSRASELLNISQPTVSQHIQALESHMGQKLFARKSKGVVETDHGRILNTLVSGSIETLEEAENMISQRYSNRVIIQTIGISAHLYKSMLCKEIMGLGEHVHVKFGTKQQLITDVEEGRLLYAIVPEVVNTFDIVGHKLFDQKMILVGTPDIDLGAIEKVYKKDPASAEKILNRQTWFAHDSNSSYIKVYWLNIFNKKRPAIIPNFVIPNEFEVLFQLSQSAGLSIATDTVAAPFIKEGKLKQWNLKEIVWREMGLLANKKKAQKEVTDKLLRLLSK